MDAHAFTPREFAPSVSAEHNLPTEMNARMRLLVAFSAGVAGWLLSRATRDTPPPVSPAAANRDAIHPPAPSDPLEPPTLRRAAATAETSSSPDDAAARILAHLPADRLAVASALLVELSHQPATAVDLARTLCALDPEFVREHGSTLITVLTETGNHAAALQFAANGGPERVHWLELTFERWARVDPRGAAEAAFARSDPDGLAIVCAEWSARDPAGFAAFVREPPLAGSAAARAALQE